jgi:hypothetical protein
MRRKENYAAGVGLGKCKGVHSFGRKPVRRNNLGHLGVDGIIIIGTSLNYMLGHRLDSYLSIWPEDLQNKVMKLWVK